MTPSTRRVRSCLCASWGGTFVAHRRRLDAAEIGDQALTGVARRSFDADVTHPCRSHQDTVYKLRRINTLYKLRRINTKHNSNTHTSFGAWAGGAQPHRVQHSGRLLAASRGGQASGFGDLVYATVPLGSVATKVARDWLANELYEASRCGRIDAA